MTMAMACDQFIDRELKAGKWQISYHDDSHLPDGRFIHLAEVVLDALPKDGDLDSELPSCERYFSIKYATAADLSTRFREAWKDDGQEKAIENQAEPYASRVLQELSDSLARCRLCAPCLDKADIDELRAETSLVLVTDTGALRRGVVGYLADVLYDKPIWVMIPVIVMLELQQAAGPSKWPLGKKPSTSNHTYLGSRPTITCATHEVGTLKRRLPVEFISVSPELLRYFGGKDSGGEEWPRILPDRLIIEGIKDCMRQRSTDRRFHIVSDDVDLVRFARLENLPAIYPRKFVMRTGGDKIRSVRYDRHAQRFMGCSFRELIWDLTRVFTTVRINVAGAKTARQFRWYWPGKTPIEWELGMVQVEEVTP